MVEPFLKARPNVSVGIIRAKAFRPTSFSVEIHDCNFSLICWSLSLNPTRYPLPFNIGILADV